MKLTDKAKKHLALTGLGVICIVLVIAIALQFKTEEPKDAVFQPSSTITEDAAPNAEIPTASTVSKVPEISVQPIDPTSSANVTAAADTADSTGTEQSLQAEPVKPEAPAEPPTPKEDSAISNPAKLPEYKPEDTVKSEPSSPKGGDKNEKGRIWFPGFGWVDDEGANTGTQVGNDDDELTGNKVGSMD